MVVGAVLPPRTGWGFEFASSPEPGQVNHSLTPVAQSPYGLLSVSNSSILHSAKRKMSGPDRYEQDSDDDNTMNGSGGAGNDGGGDFEHQQLQHNQQRQRQQQQQQPRLNSSSRPSPAKLLWSSPGAATNSSNSEMDLFSSSFQKKLSTGTFRASNSSKISKRARTHAAIGHPLPIGRILESLDKKNLKGLVETLCQSHPYLVDEITSLAPRITVSTAIEHLKTLLSNVYGNLPFKGDQRGDYAYLRVRPAVEEFLNALSDYTSNFLPPTEPQPSNTLAFLDLATGLLHELPVWSSSINNHRQWVGYDDLSSAWIVAIKAASKRAGGLGLVHDGWQTKLDNHNTRSEGRLQDAVTCIREELAWLSNENSVALENHFVAPQLASRLWT